MYPQHDVTGLILAGGAGRRVSGRDKGLIEWQGKTLVAHVVQALQCQVGELLISCNRNEDIYRGFGLQLVSDQREDFQGPLAGIESAAALVDTPFLVVVPCDTPGLPGDLVDRLLAPLQDPSGDTADISFVHDGKRGQYLCAAMHSKVLASLSDYLDSGQRAVRHWYSQHRVTAVDFSDQQRAFENYNYID